MSGQNLDNALRDALDAHIKWKRRLEDAMTPGAPSLDPDEVCCDKSCAFGQFLHGGGIEPALKATKPFEVVSRLHHEFHQAACGVALKINQARLEEALYLMSTDYKDKSEKLMRALNKWRGEMTVTS